MSTGYSQTFPNTPSTTGEFNMNSLMGPDFCAISALNQLSNSSVPFHHNDTTTGDEEEKKKSLDEKSGKPRKCGKQPKSPPKTSFYERVMANKAISKK